MTAMSHFSSQTIQYAESAGVPFASLAVPLSGIIAVLGGLSVMLGYKIKAGAWLIVLFLVPVTFSMHAFWNITDPMIKQMQMIMFFKNISLVGGSLAFAYNGAGPLSIDNRIASADKVKTSHVNFGSPVKV
jgi:putative oxidoreductase